MHDAGRFFAYAVCRKALSSVCRLDSGWGVLLDAGEGSWGSLVRMYGHKAAFDQVLHRTCLHFVTLRSYTAFGIDFTLS